MDSWILSQCKQRSLLDHHWACGLYPRSIELLAQASLISILPLDFYGSRSQFSGRVCSLVVEKGEESSSEAPLLESGRRTHLNGNWTLFMMREVGCKAMCGYTGYGTVELESSLWKRHMCLWDVSAYTGTRYFRQAAGCQKQKHQR